MEISRKFYDLFEVEEDGAVLRNGYVPDWMLIEILTRLPVKSVFRFKSVSKQWLSLISDPFFIRFYNSRSSKQPWTILATTLHVGNSDFPKNMLLPEAFSGDQDLPCFSALPLPCFPDKTESKSFEVVSVSEGFVLYAERLYSECGVSTLTNYAIFSPSTAQTLALPPPPRRLSLSTTGFVTRVENGALRSFRVVRVNSNFQRSNTLEIEMLCSETGEWTHSVLHTDLALELCWRRMPASFAGNLHWIDRTSGIVGYDPYKDRVRIIGLPGEIDSQCNEAKYNGLPSLCIGQGGFLWYFEVLVTPADYFRFSGFRTWRLSDYESNEWTLYRKSDVNDIKFDENLNIGMLVGFIPVPITFHPFSPEVVYLGWGDNLVSYDFGTGKMETVDRNPIGNLLRKGGMSVEPRWWQSSLLVPPTWPTPIALTTKK